MSKKYVVQFKNVSKIYEVKKDNKSNVRKKNEKFYALKDISFEVEQGDIVGILGTNGSGKSTLSKIIAGISLHNSGEVNIKGEQALIAINSGLNNKLTGLENIELKGVLLGFSKEKIKDITQSVIEFSELGDFIYQPVKTYSSGMKARLGFSISVNIDPDIIIVDEALSVGDKTFNEKCLKKISELKENGKTIFYVSHSMQELKNFCKKGLWVEGGTLKAYDEINTVIKQYEDHVKEYKKKSDEEKKEYRKIIYEKRLLNDDYKINLGRVKTNKKSKVLKIISSLVVLGLVSLPLLKLRNTKANEMVPIGLNKEYNYTFMINGSKVEEYKDAYRDYISNADGMVITDIVNVSFKRNAKDIKITEIPTNLQYYYKKLGLTDEISLLNHIDKNLNNQEEFLELILGHDIDKIYTIEERNIKKYNNMLKNKKMTSMTEKEIKNVIGILLSGNKNSDEILEVISEYVKSSKQNNIIYDYENIKVKEIKLSEILKDKIKNLDKELRDKVIVYVDGSVDITKNIYIARSKEEEVIEEREEDKDSSTSDEDITSPSTDESITPPSTGGGSTQPSTNEGITPPSTGGDSTQPSTDEGITPPSTGGSSTSSSTDEDITPPSTENDTNDQVM